MTTGTNACNGMRSLQQALAYHPGKLLDCISYRTARASELRPPFRQVHTQRTRPVTLSSHPLESSVVSPGNEFELQWQGGRKHPLYLPRHLRRASACVHTSSSTSTPLTTDFSQISQNPASDTQSSSKIANGNAYAPSTSIGELHCFQDDAEAEAMLWAYELWLKREHISGDKGVSWTQKVQVSDMTTEGLYVHIESLDCAGKPQLLASVSAPTKVGS